MAIFPNLELEAIVQEKDKTRLDASKSFISKGEAAVTLVRIKPETSGSFITVTGTSVSDWFLDWSYSTDGVKTVSVEITTDGAPITVTKDITVITEANDKLFSKDSDLQLHESDILKYVRRGRNSFKDYHRRSQELILAYLDNQGYVDSLNQKFTKDSVVDVSEFAEWSKFQTLTNIFRDLSNSIGDIFEAKSKLYEKEMISSRQKLKFRIDKDGDDLIGDGESLLHHAPRLVRI